MSEAYISGISYYLPTKVLTNDDIHQNHPEWSVDKISQKTGVEQRYLVAGDECSSDLGVKAAERLFDEYSVDKACIDYLILCTQSPDYFLPTTACIIQDRLGLGKHIGALDINLGCSGFVYGLGLAKGLIVSGQATNVLLITAETYSKFIHPKDKSNKTIFGDAAAATLITDGGMDVKGHKGKICSFVNRTDGSGYHHLIVRNGGMRHPERNAIDEYDESGSFIKNDDFLFMDGKEIFNFTAFQVPGLVNDIIIKNEIAKEAVDHFIFHQANSFMLQTIRKRCGIPAEAFYVNMSCANTVSSTIPIALYQAFSEGLIKDGQKVMIAGFGVGLSMSGTIINF
jgi:3-oxoacyl-[acyl-carrier-protein] synthase III